MWENAGDFMQQQGARASVGAKRSFDVSHAIALDMADDIDQHHGHRANRARSDRPAQSALMGEMFYEVGRQRVQVHRAVRSLLRIHVRASFQMVGVGALPCAVDSPCGWASASASSRTGSRSSWSSLHENRSRLGPDHDSRSLSQAPTGGRRGVRTHRGHSSAQCRQHRPEPSWRATASFA